MRFPCGSARQRHRESSQFRVVQAEVAISWIPSPAASSQGPTLGSKGIRGQDLGAGLEVVAVNLQDTFGRIEECVGGPEWQARGLSSPLQFGSDRPIEDQGRPPPESALQRPQPRPRVIIGMRVRIHMPPSAEAD